MIGFPHAVSSLVPSRTGTRRAAPWLWTGGILGLLVISVAIFVIARVSDLSSEQRATCGQIKERLEQVEGIRVQVVNDLFRTAKKGEPDFENAIGIFKSALHSQKVWTGPLGKPIASAQLLGASSELLVTIDLYDKAIGIRGLPPLWAKGAGGIHTDFDNAYSREVFFYASGARRAQGMFNQGKEEGHWTYFFENGQKMSEGAYVNGKKDGRWISWDIKGNKTLDQEFRSGKLVSEKARP